MRKKSYQNSYLHSQGIRYTIATSLYRNLDLREPWVLERRLWEALPIVRQAVAVETVMRCMYPGDGMRTLGITQSIIDGSDEDIVSVYKKA
jgi:hypothetical protein